jgi:hypothetical protein
MACRNNNRENIEAKRNENGVMAIIMAIINGINNNNNNNEIIMKIMAIIMK